jgi:hypothetical protein
MGRKSLGTRPKKVVQGWLNNATEAQLLAAAVGNAPSLAEVVKMVHPKPTDAWREALLRLGEQDGLDDQCGKVGEVRCGG